MAKNLRPTDSGPRDLDTRRKAEIAVEALRQSESCLYTSTAIFIWLRRVRWQHKIVLLAPIVLTAIAGFSYVKEWVPVWAVALMAFLATLIPSLAEALEIQTHVEELKTKAAEFKALQDRFRRLAKITVLGNIDRAEAELSDLMDRMDVVRSGSITPPEKYYVAARDKIRGGDYDFSIDQALRDMAADGGVAALPKAT
ncbi:SLATT domain-containing protein (plasmid) [Mesorhizobium mediterraneum]|uniref:SLATT domain-containing protein n=1 Tax=Mesorhizobium mediterraneum TaxID=43617 RepID=UPI0025583584|nr:SLATT domain-containing protein [Mesorhizobium mediterraneum]WIW57341.1 SLATT domain-containing protein [Mesorhizobium mediterraneum]